LKESPIGIFDSGVGGLTVVHEITVKLPAEDIIYFGDTARFPYGTKTSKQLIGFTRQICDFLLEKKVKLIIIACNSASSAALEWAQEHFEIPIVGVVEPGARAAYMATVNRKIGVIGTEATIESNSYERAVHSFDAGIHVYQAPCPYFATYVENGRTDGDDIRVIAESYLKPLREKNIDSLILGCTHYPLLSGLIAEVMGSQAKLISSAEETALEVKEILKRKAILREDRQGVIKFFSTGSKDKFIELGSRFLGRKINETEQVTL
jgi:glutamate racemase